MARYIKAVECAEIISEKMNIPLADLVDVFAEIPTADVAEVKNGYWVDHFPHLQSVECSVCGKTANEIVKALECCIRDDSGEQECNGCPYDIHTDCTLELRKATLDLINRLQAEVENYKQIAEHQQSVTMDRGFEIKRLKRKIEELNKEISDRELSHINLYNEMRDRMETAKAEAYKECIERGNAL